MMRERRSSDDTAAQAAQAAAVAAKEVATDEVKKTRWANWWLIVICVLTAAGALSVGLIAWDINERRVQTEHSINIQTHFFCIGLAMHGYKEVGGLKVCSADYENMIERAP